MHFLSNWEFDDSKAFGFGKKVEMKNKILIVPPPSVKMTRIISVYVIFAFLLMSFSGCGKLMNIVGLNQPEIKPSNVSNKKLNQDNILTPTPVFVSLDNSSDTDAKKESWKEWTCRQWTDNKWYWISGTAVVAVAAAVVGIRYYYSSPPAVNPQLSTRETQTQAPQLELHNVLSVDVQPPQRPIPQAPQLKLQISEPTYYSYTPDVPQFPEELIEQVMEEMTEARQTLAQVMEHSEDGPEQDANRLRFLFLSHFSCKTERNLRAEVFTSVLNELPEEEIFFVEPE
jgi:hypothetical protein